MYVGFYIMVTSLNTYYLKSFIFHYRIWPCYNVLCNNNIIVTYTANRNIGNRSPSLMLNYVVGGVVV